MATLRGITLQGVTNGLTRIANEPQTQARLFGLAHELKARAIKVYVRQVRHPNTEAPYYISSFHIVPVRGKDIKGFRFSNTDPTWLWIEFGAHAGGKTKILRYKPITTALQEMGAENE